MKNFIFIVFALFCFSAINCLYGSNSDVIKLTSANFNKEVIKGNELWLVEFFAPWCGHCKNLAPEWEKAAKALKGIIKVGAIDMDADKSFGAQYNIQGFPTIKFFGANKATPMDYNGDRSAQAIVNFALEKAKALATQRLSGKKDGSSSSSSGSQNKKNSASSDKDVVVLDDNNFEKTVLNSNDMWLVEFYAPWCGHCKKLEPEWNQAASDLKGKIKLGKVDATVHTQLAAKYGIQGYPTIKIFPPGKKTAKSAESYEGPRDASGIVTFALEKLEKYGYVPDIEQLINQDQFKENCEDRVGVCIITFLPHIFDSGAAQRNSYLDILKDVSKHSRGKPVNFMWAQGADFFELEEKLSLAFGYPAVVAISSSKKKYAVMRNAFSEANVKTFVSNLLIGKESVSDLPQLPKIKTVKAWDGKDAQPEPEVNIDDDL